jgi:hypothetical protein
MSHLCIPNKKIVIASSFEGVFNNGAKECAFVSINAFNKMAANKALSSKGFFGQRILEPDEFRGKKVSDSVEVKAFLALRPLVAVAEDYLTVLLLIDRYPGGAAHITREMSETNVSFFTANFNDLKGRMQAERTAFKSAFYQERKARQEKDYRSWLALQEPYPETLEQLRILNALKDSQPGSKVNGFFLYYVTSKDEQSTLDLCKVYAQFGQMGTTEILDAIPQNTDWQAYLRSLQTCLISPERIIGITKVPGGDKLRQMSTIFGLENMNDPAQVWRINDRYDEEEIASLKGAGFVHYFVSTGGYAFPEDYEKARRNGIPVIERSHLADSLSDYAAENGF